ncbi:M23 family metallopeptidase [Streptomyces profundus]|uniref:M23 family metallopeptidase n=1 Tax=Streptomyces profundus TaxID=2867410 RepID=UPI001D16FA28|nr:M23 family metallopeptidase [Streptomyces sp. MA3_2.13]UED83580.1 M23 family metallopeptidase [Streptomyces sp. MA3_2.13]
MLNTTTITTRTPKTLRARAAAAVVAGACATVALTGAAVAAEGTQADAFASGTAIELADSTRGQAEALRAAAESGETTAEAAPAKAAKAAEAAKDWVSPIPGDYELSATYGNSGDRWTAKHSGQDFAVPSGTKVHAVHDGTVVKAGGNGAGDGPAYGNAVVIKHDDGTFSQYAHLSQVDVEVGQDVSADERIALSGNTGNSSGPHLHFEIRTSADYGTAIDPMKFLRDQDAEV